MPDALLIDDEAACRADLRRKLGAHPGIHIVGEASTLRSGRALLREADYSLVFFDVQLIGGTSFDLVPEVRPGARIVFVTAHDAFALRAFEVNALDYLLKPVSPDRLAATMRRLAGPEEAEAPAQEPERLLPTGARLRYDDTVYLRTGLKAMFVRLDRIGLITAEDNYSQVTLLDGTRVFLRKSLQAWESSLPPQHFMRVHRTQIVNLTLVTRYERDADERTQLFLAGWSVPIAASRHRWQELRERLAALRPAL